MTLAALAFAAVLGFAAFGWGLGVRRLARLPAGSWPVTVALGIAAIVVLGGLLNDLGQATAVPLAIVALAGLAWIAVVRPRLDAVPDRLVMLVAVGVPLVLTVAAAILLVPPSAYNYGDDLEKYFAYPVRMLATGTLAGSSLNSMGAETLGGQSILDGLALTVLPVDALNVIDTVFGFGLCLFLVAGAAERRLSAALLGLSAMILIHPQSVNISSLYTGAALMAAAVALTGDPREEPKPAALGLIYAALIAMKPTFALFVVLHAAANTTVLVLETRRIKPAAVWLGTCAGCGVAASLPWLVLHAPYYFAPTVAPLVPMPRSEPLNLLSSTTMAYGVSFLDYTLAVIAAAAAAGWAVWSKRDRAAVVLAATALVLAAVYLILILAGGPMLAGYYMSLRYFTPFAIALLPTIFVFAARDNAGRPVWPLVAMALPLTLFAPTFLARCEQAWTTGHVLAFSEVSSAPGYLAYSRTALSDEAAEHVKAVQNLVPAGEPLVAWINQPFRLDFARNPIADVNTAGLAAPWAALPKAEYVIWEYDAYASPRMAPDIAHIDEVGAHEWTIDARTVAFAKHLRALSGHGEALYNDGHLAVFRIDRTPAEAL